MNAYKLYLYLACNVKLKGRELNRKGKDMVMLCFGYVDT